MDDLRPIARAFADAPHSEKANSLSRQTFRRGPRGCGKRGALFVVQSIRQNNLWRRARAFFENSLFIVIGHIEQIAMGQRTVGVTVKQPGRETVKDSAEKFSARLIRPSAAAKPHEF